jgi:hypothetical protein
MAQTFSKRKGFSKGTRIYKTKRLAEKMGKKYQNAGAKYRIVKLANGYRVDTLHGWLLDAGIRAARKG